MNLRIVTVADRGVANRERLHLSVLAGANLSFYAVFESVRQGNGITIGARRGYWFPAFVLKPGDNVVLYTGLGADITRPRKDGGTDYFFYWGMPETLWADPLSCAVLLEIANWETSI